VIRTGGQRRRRAACAVAALILAAVLAAALAGCGGARRSSAPAGRRVDVSERDFHIEAPTHLPAGRLVIRVHNEGPDQHELIVVPGAGSALPIRVDGVTVDEEAVEASEPGSLPPGEPGSTRLLAVDLKPGRYVFFCNMEGHFMGGMHAEVTVG
jgi:uncharacterized cupredoxin-like copper-binding protein